MAVLDAAVMIGPPYPEARVVTPVTYASFAEIQNRGNVIEAVGEEREAVMALSVQRIELHLTEPVQRYMRLMDSLSKTVERTIKQEAARMAALIEARVKSGGEYPFRSAERYINQNLRYDRNLAESLPKPQTE